MKDIHLPEAKCLITQTHFLTLERPQRHFDRFEFYIYNNFVEKK